MVPLNNIAMICHRRIFWNTPYRTGNLASNGISDLRGYGGRSVGFSLFGVGTEYGAILNEVPVIQYKLTNRKTGKVYTGSYTNRHYKWVDRFADEFAAEIPINFPNIERAT